MELDNTNYGYHINEDGELIFRGEIIRISSEYQNLKPKQKADILELLQMWIISEVEKL